MAGKVSLKTGALTRTKYTPEGLTVWPVLSK